MTTALLIAAAVLAGLVAVLKVVAPMTKTKKDDEALALAEKAEEVVDGLKK